jgi:hypothetical protein
MSVEEVWVAIIGTIVAILMWSKWYRDTAGIWPALRQPARRGPLWVAPLIAAALIAAALTTGSSFDVVNDARYLYMYFALGLAWVGLATKAFPATGLILRDDVVERANPAVAPALGGAILGIGAAYAGSNIGDGPGWWAVALSAGVATIAFMATWLLHESLAHSSDAITIDRDEAAGWRLGGFLLAAGLILGRAVAGDWESEEALYRDTVAAGWPLLGLLATGYALERGTRGTAATPHPPVATKGWLPAVVMVSLAIAWLAWSGLPA